MDVLKDVKKAEGDAERIEQDYGAKAASLIASVVADLETRRKELTAELDDELGKKAAKLDQQFHSEREAILTAGHAQRESAEKSARSDHVNALEIILKALRR